MAATTADSVLLEPNLPQTVRRTIALQRWPERLSGFRIALLSDFHYDPLFSVHPLHASIDVVNRLKPDLIVLTGDFVSAPLFGRWAQKAAAAAEPCAELLKRMKCRFGSWAVLGNHDCYTDPERVTAAIEAKGIKILINKSMAIEQDGVRFWLAGVDDCLGGTPDLDTTLKHVPRGEPTILLAHEPDYADWAKDYPVDLQLSGHSHGGQVRLPLMRPLYLPELARKYISGLYQVGPLTLYTNRGLGTVGLPVRLNCPPEITLIEVQHASG